MKPTHMTDKLSDFVDGNLTPAEIERVKSHLIFCNACRNHLEDLTKNIRLLNSVPGKNPPTGLLEQILQKIQQAPQTDEPTPIQIKERTSPIHWLRPLGVMASMVLALTVFWKWPVLYLKMQPTSKTVAPAEVTHEYSAVPQENLGSPPISAAAIPEPVRLVRGSPRQKSMSAASQALPVSSMGAGRDSLEQIPVPNSEQHVDRRANYSGPPSLSDIPSKEKKRLLMNDTKIEKAFLKKAEPVMEASPLFLELHGQQSGITDAKQLVISSQKQWGRLWRQHTKNHSPIPELPIVDFDKNEVVAVFLGSSKCDERTLSIIHVEETIWEGKPARVVYYQIQNMVPGYTSNTIECQLFAIKSAPRLSGQTFFRETP